MNLEDIIYVPSLFSHVQLCVTLRAVACGLRCPWNSPGQNTGVGCHALLQGIFSTQGSNPHFLCLPHCQAGSLPVAPPTKPWRHYAEWNKSVMKGLLLYNSTYMKFLELLTSLRQLGESSLPEPGWKGMESSCLMCIERHLSLFSPDCKHFKLILPDSPLSWRS